MQWCWTAASELQLPGQPMNDWRTSYLARILQWAYFLNDHVRGGVEITRELGMKKEASDFILYLMCRRTLSTLTNEIGWREHTCRCLDTQRESSELSIVLPFVAILSLCRTTVRQYYPDPLAETRNPGTSQCTCTTCAINVCLENILLNIPVTIARFDKRRKRRISFGRFVDERVSNRRYDHSQCLSMVVVTCTTWENWTWQSSNIKPNRENRLEPKKCTLFTAFFRIM